MEVQDRQSFDHQYGPVQAGEFWGPQSDRGLLFSKSGFSYRLAAQPGASARFVTSLDNLGVHSVRATIVEGNTASIALHESLGFGVRRDRVIAAKDLGE